MSSLERTMVGDVHVITVKKNLVGGQETDELSQAIQAAAAETPRVVVDLSKINHLSSTGLGALVQANTHCLNRGGWFRIAGAGNRIKNVFLITKLVFVFDTYETVDDAVGGKREQD